LEGFECGVVGGCHFAAGVLDVWEGCVSIDVRFTGAQEVEVGPVEEED
jgi:hypothetical protein